MLLENNNNIADDWNYIEKKKITHNINDDFINDEIIFLRYCWNILSAKNNKVIGRTEDEEANNKIKYYKINSQKAKKKVKKRPNIAITEQYFGSQSKETVPSNRPYADITRH